MDFIVRHGLGEEELDKANEQVETQIEIPWEYIK